MSLAVYYVLVAGAVATAWKVGLLEHSHPGGSLASVGVAIAMGALPAILSQR